jgi:hypothetical protein
MEKATSEENPSRTPDLPVIQAETAAEVCDKCSLREEAVARLEDGMTPSEFLTALMGEELYADAIKFLAQALPKKEAIIWARDCAGDATVAIDRACLEAIDAWLENPEEKTRRAAMDLADEAGYSTAAAATAAAAGWTEGSMGPAEYDDVPPPENLSGTMVSTAVLLAAAVVDPLDTKAKQKQLIEQGIELALGDKN